MSIADKITALIRQADESKHKGEADAFMRKVHVLLENHGMSLLDIGTLQTDDPLGETEYAGDFTPVESSFRDTAFAAAKYYGCEATIGPRYVDINSKFVKRHSITVYGRQNARTTFTLMWPYIKRAMIDAGRELQNKEKQQLLEAYGTEGAKFIKPKSMSVHMRHVSTALEDRIRRMISQNNRTRKDNGLASRGVNALVPVDLIAELIPDRVKAAKAVKKETTRAAIKKAEGIGLDLQTEGKRTKLKRIAK